MRIFFAPSLSRDNTARASVSSVELAMAPAKPISLPKYFILAELLFFSLSYGLTAHKFIKFLALNALISGQISRNYISNQGKIEWKAMFFGSIQFKKDLISVSHYQGRWIRQFTYRYIRAVRASKSLAQEAPGPRAVIC